MQIERMKLTNRKSVATYLVPLSSMVVTATVLLGPIAFAAEKDIYKTIDDDGTTLFTDKPSNSTTVIAPTEPNVLVAPQSAPLSIPQPTPISILDTQTDDDYEDNEQDGNFEAADPRPLTVTSVKITSPANEQTIINPQGPILIGIETGPEDGMPEGYTSELILNGEVVTSAEGTLLALPAPHRGTHIIEAIVVNSKGVIQASSQAVRIHVKKSFVRTEE